MSLTAVTVLRSGGCFDPIWVDRIVRQIKEHINPDRIVCLTDMDVKSCEAIPLKHNWPGWFSKMELFRPDLFEGTCVYFDLDTLILGGIPDAETPITGLVMLDDFYRPREPASGMMFWEPESCHVIYDNFARNPICKPGLKHGDGAIIGKHCRFRIQRLWPGLVGSYKKDRLQNGPGGFKVVCFHGTPKQHELPKTSWARRYWEGV